MRWQFEAGRILDGFEYRGLDCKRRVKILADEMTKAGETFEIWYGVYGPTKHVWIKYDGFILDPTQEDDTPVMYKPEQVITLGWLNWLIDEEGKY